MPYLVCTLAAVLVGATLAAAANNRFRIHPNSRIEIRGLCGGPDGLLWIAAIADGSVWVGANEGLARRDTGAFRTELSEAVLGLAARAGEVFLRTRTRLLRIADGGAITVLDPPGHVHLTVTPSGDLWYVAGQHVYCLPRGTAKPERVGPASLTGADLQAAPTADGSVWLSDGESAISHRVLSVSRNVPPGVPAGAPALHLGPRGHLWLLPRSLRRLHPASVLSWDYLPSVP